jgi:hypothetical protein
MRHFSLISWTPFSHGMRNEMKTSNQCEPTETQEGKLYLDKVIDRRIRLVTENLPSFLQIVLVSDER